MKKIVYDMAKTTDTKLLDERGCMCPLGAFLLDAGVPREALLGVTSPEELKIENLEPEDLPGGAQWVLQKKEGKTVNSTDAGRIIEAASHLPDEDAQTEIWMIFKNYGVDFEFDNFPLPVLPLDDPEPPRFLRVVR